MELNLNLKNYDYTLVILVILYDQTNSHHTSGQHHL